MSDNTLELAVIMGRKVLANKWAIVHWEALGVVPDREGKSKQRMDAYARGRWREPPRAVVAPEARVGRDCGTAGGSRSPR